MSEYRQEIIAKSRCKSSEYYETLPNINKIVLKYSALPNLIKLSKDGFQCYNKIKSAKFDYINQYIITNEVRDLTANNTHADNNLLVDAWECLKLTLATSTESLFNILDYLEEYLRKSPFLIDKYYESLHSHERK